MKTTKHIFGFIILLLFMTSFSQCSSSKKAKEQQILVLEEEVSFEPGEVYCQRWTSGLKEGGSGLHVYISIRSNKKNVTFDSIYFRGQRGKIEIGKMGYFANLETVDSQKKDMIMSSDSKDEFENEFPIQKSNFPFNLKNDECVLRFDSDNNIQYYKISNVVERAALNYPSTPPNKQ